MDLVSELLDFRSERVAACFALRGKDSLAAMLPLYGTPSDSRQRRRRCCETTSAAADTLSEKAALTTRTCQDQLY